MTTSSSGILSGPERPFQLNQYRIAGPSADYIAYLWSVAWSLPEGQSYSSANIPYPCVHLVFGPGQSGIFGPVKGSFNKVLTGSSFVLGARFKTGLFTPFSGLAANSLTDKVLDLASVLAQSNQQLEQRWADCTAPEQAINRFTELLNSAVPSQAAGHKKAQLAFDICHFIEHNAQLSRVEMLPPAFGLSRRALERLFNDYVGLTPKRVIRLFRLQQLADQIIHAPEVDWTELAHRLGYFDQAHCIKDFKAYTGKTPTAFRPNLAALANQL